MATEIPRCFSISMKSEVVAFRILLLFTAPAVTIAPPKRMGIFGEGRLTGVGVTDDAESPAFRDFFSSSMERADKAAPEFGAARESTHLPARLNGVAVCGAIRSRRFPS